MRTFFIAIGCFILLIGFFVFMFLTIDIVDGRDMLLKASPHFRANTNTIALALSITSMLGCLVFCFLVARLLRKS